MIFDLEQQLKRILSRDLSFSNKIEPCTDVITVVYDSEIYKNVFREHEEEIRSGNVFTFSLNTDGISICEKSDLSITPIILAINELPLCERFCIENMCIAG